jgi:hypothetical protein
VGVEFFLVSFKMTVNGYLLHAQFTSMNAEADTSLHAEAG